MLVNNFGTSNPGKDLDFANTDPQVFLDTENLNLRSVFMASQAAAKHMAKQGGGSIINISSVGGLVPDISQVAYGTSKAAVNPHTTKVGKGFDESNLRKMRQFYCVFPIRDTLCPELSWSHYRLLME